MTKNIFRKALIILSRKSQGMTDEEREIVNTALIPLMIVPQYSDKPICKGLKNLAKMTEETK